MNSKMNRRQLLGASVIALPAAAAGRKALAQTPVTNEQLQDGPKIGHGQQQFENWFGPGTPEDSFIHYPPLVDGRASYYVAFDDADHSQLIIGNFNDLPAGGIEFDWANAGESQFIRGDAAAGELFQFVYFKSETGYYAMRSWQSSELAEETGGSGYVTVLDRITSGMLDPSLFRETMIATEIPEVIPILPTGEKLGPHSSMQEWIEYNNGQSVMSEAGLNLDDPPLPGFWVIMDSLQVWAELDTPIPTNEAAELISSMLPPSDLIGTTWYGQNPVSETQIRLHEFVAHDTGSHHLGAQFVEGDEQTGTVTKFYLANVRDTPQASRNSGRTNT